MNAFSIALFSVPSSIQITSFEENGVKKLREYFSKAQDCEYKVSKYLTGSEMPESLPVHLHINILTYPRALIIVLVHLSYFNAVSSKPFVEFGLVLAK